MFNVTGMYVTVFNPTIDKKKERTVFATLSTSKKNVKEGAVTYENMSWNASFVGAAYDKALNLKDRDKIDVIKGAITNRYDKELRRLYVDVIVFDFNKSVVQICKS